MAKEKLTVEQIRSILKEKNPQRFGENANPLVPNKCKFILVGIMKDDTEGNKVERFVQVTKLSEEAKKANPGLTSTQYIRILKTDDVPEVVEATDTLRTARKPIPDNLFERQQPLVFEQIVRLLKQKDGKEYKFFINMEKDGNGNPRLKLKNPVLGVFATLNVPGHYVRGTDGNFLTGARKDLGTNTFGKAEKIVMRTINMFLFEHDIEKFEEMAIGAFQRTVEPLLAEEVKISLDESGRVINKEVKNTSTVEQIDHSIAPEETPVKELELEDLGV